MLTAAFADAQVHGTGHDRRLCDSHYRPGRRRHREQVKSAHISRTSFRFLLVPMASRMVLPLALGLALLARQHLRPK